MLQQRYTCHIYFGIVATAERRWQFPSTNQLPEKKSDAVIEAAAAIGSIARRDTPVVPSHQTQAFPSASAPPLATIHCYAARHRHEGFFVNIELHRKSSRCREVSAGQSVPERDSSLRSTLQFFVAAAPIPVSFHRFAPLAPSVTRMARGRKAACVKQILCSWKWPVA
jgi:hypothetical protein